MPESQLLNDRVYGSAEAAIFSQKLISDSSSADGFAETDAFFSTHRAQVATRPQVRCGDRNWTVSGSSATHKLPKWLLPSVNDLAGILALPPGWNSHSAKPINWQNAVAALVVLSDLSDFNTPPPAVVPRVQGNIQLEWHMGEIDIEIYIDSPDSVQFFAEDSLRDLTAEGSLVGRKQELREWLGLLASERD